MSLTRYRRLCQEIRLIMSRHEWSQTDLARQIGTKQPVISAWLSGESYPGERLRRELAKLNGKTLDQFDAFIAGQTLEEQCLPETAEQTMPWLRKLDSEEKLNLISLLANELKINLDN